MCGIIGVIGGVLDEKRVLAARDTLTHRGPDDADLYHDAAGGVVLGHRRLSIIDLSPAGRQPLWGADRRLRIVFYGENYNYF